MIQPDIFDLLSEPEGPDLYRLRVRDDATGPVARWAGEEIGNPMPLREAEAIRQAMPNGRHTDVIPAAICPRCDRRHAAHDATVSGSRWALGPTAYRATYDGAPTRPTREQAIQDMCDHRQHAPAARQETKP